MLIHDYQFKEDQVTFLPNCKKDEFLNQLEKILPSKSTSQTRLLIWVISHGTVDKTIEFSDAPVQADDIWNRLGKKKGDGSYSFECKQILFVIDACYSGAMIKDGQEEYNPSRSVCDAVEAGSRIVVTSTSFETTRESQFTREFLKQLTINSKPYLTIDKLFDESRKEFLKSNSGNTNPRLTIFDDVNHQDKGSYLFIKKKFFK